jgi:hypothetical protein
LVTLRFRQSRFRMAQPAGLGLGQYLFFLSFKATALDLV